MADAPERWDGCRRLSGAGPVLAGHARLIWAATKPDSMLHPLDSAINASDCHAGEAAASSRSAIELVGERLWRSSPWMKRHRACPHALSKVSLEGLQPSHAPEAPTIDAKRRRASLPLISYRSPANEFHETGSGARRRLWHEVALEGSGGLNAHFKPRDECFASARRSNMKMA